MKALNDLAKTRKGKLKAFQKEIDSLRPGLLGDSTIEEWKGLPNDERKLKITVFLCMARVEEDELERIAQTLNPRWEPFLKGGMVLLALFALYFIYQLSTYLLADRVYPKAFEYNVQFMDGTVRTYGLFDNSSMIRKDSGSVTVLLEEGIVNWILGESKKATYDSTVWTPNKDFSKELITFYEDFNGDPLMFSEFKKVLLPIDKIYEATKRVAGEVPNLRMDLVLPKNLANDHSPILSVPKEGTSYIFFSATDKNNFWNIKLDFRGNEVLNAEQLQFYPTFEPDKQRKVIWHRNYICCPILKKFFKDSTVQQPEEYSIYNLNEPIARP